MDKRSAIHILLFHLIAFTACKSSKAGPVSSVKNYDQLRKVAKAEDGQLVYVTDPYIKGWFVYRRDGKPFDNGGTVIIGKGKQGNWTRQFEGNRINVQWFSVIPNGADMTENLNKVLSQQANIELYFPPSASGYYAFKDITVSDKQKVHFTGSDTKVRMLDGGQFFFTFQNCSSVSIQNFRFDGNAEKVQGKTKPYTSSFNFFISDNDLKADVNVSDNLFMNLRNGGVFLDNRKPEKGKAFGVGFHNSIIQNNDFIDYGEGPAIRFRGAHKNVSISKNRISDPLNRHKYGKVVEVTSELGRPDGSGNVVIEQNSFEHVNHCAIFGQFVSNLQVRNNSGIDLGSNEEIFVFIKLDDLEGSAIIDGNICREFNTRSSRAVTIQSSGPDTKGRKASRHVIISNNILGYGVRLGGDGKYVVSNNILFNYDSRIGDSTVAPSAMIDINTKGSNRNIISNNLIYVDSAVKSSYTVNHGIRCVSSNNLIEGNLVLGIKSHGIYLDGNPNGNIVQGNMVEHNANGTEGASGIFINNSSGAFVTENYCIGDGSQRDMYIVGDKSKNSLIKNNFDFTRVNKFGGFKENETTIQNNYYNRKGKQKKLLEKSDKKKTLR